MRLSLIFFAVIAILAQLALAAPAAADEKPIVLVIRDHHFAPAEVDVAAGEKHVLEVDNQDESAEEFESYTLHREKIIPAKSKARVTIGPLKPGRYEFMGEFHSDLARGVVIAK